MQETLATVTEMPKLLQLILTGSWSKMSVPNFMVIHPSNLSQQQTIFDPESMCS